MNTSKYAPFIIGGIIIAAGLIIYSQLRPSATTTNQAAMPSKNTPNEQVSNQKTYSLSEVNQHNTPTNCWAVIRDGVYDLTNWIAQHPGGKNAIIQLCGKDGTSDFTGQHGGDASPERMLTSMKIGDLKR